MSTPAKKPKPSSAKRVAAYRQRMRAAGLVPKTIWTYNTKDPAFLAEIECQCRAIAADEAGEKEIMGWIDAVRDWPTSEDGIPDYILPEAQK